MNSDENQTISKEGVIIKAKSGAILSEGEEYLIIPEEFIGKDFPQGARVKFLTGADSFIAREVEIV